MSQSQSRRLYVKPIPTTHTIATTLHVTIILIVPSSIHTQVINTDTKFKKT